MYFYGNGWGGVNRKKDYLTYEIINNKILTLSIHTELFPLYDNSMAIA